MVALAALLLVLPVAFESAASASTFSPRQPAGTGVGAAPADDAYLSEAEEAEAEAEEEDEEAELEEAEELEESEEGEAEEEEEEEEEEGELEAEEEAGASGSGHEHAKRIGGSRTTSGNSGLAAGSHGAKLSGLALTATTRRSLSHGSANARRIDFSFATNAKATVRFTLARKGSGSHWRTVSSTTASATRGVNREHLHGSGKLASGSYRLTLSSGNGASKQVRFAVR